MRLRRIGELIGESRMKHFWLRTLLMIIDSCIIAGAPLMRGVKYHVVRCQNPVAMWKNERPKA
jgi:hypothetical protein